MIKTYIIGEVFSSTSAEAFSTYEKSRWGEKEGNKINYSGVEVLYLVEFGKMQVFLNGKEVGFEGVMKRLVKRDKKIKIKYMVFRDLRRKGYIVKTALKFGAEFRIYDKGVKPGQEHARWVVFSVAESEKINWHEFAAKNRVAHSTKKNLLIAVVDDEGEVIYYEVSWRKI